MFILYNGNYYGVANPNLNVRNTTSFQVLPTIDLSNFLTGATNLGNGAGLFTSVSNKKVQLKTLVAGSNITISPSATGVTITSSAGGGGSGTVTGATNGLSLTGAGKKIKWGGSLTGSTTVSIGTNALVITGSSTGSTVQFSRVRINNRLGIGTANPLASLHITGGTASQAPLIIQQGTANLSTPVDGAIEHTNNRWNLTMGSVRYDIALINGGFTGGRLLIGSSTSTVADSANLTFTSNQLTVNGTALIGGTSITTSALLDLQSTTRALILPRMTSTQKSSIATPSEGMMVYDTTLHKLAVYTGSVWETVTSS